MAAAPAFGTAAIYDETRFDVELLSAQVTIKAPGEIALYVAAFEKFAEMAVYGAEARFLIAAAIAALE